MRTRRILSDLLFWIRAMEKCLLRHVSLLSIILQKKYNYNKLIIITWLEIGNFAVNIAFARIKYCLISCRQPPPLLLCNASQAFFIQKFGCQLLCEKIENRYSTISKDPSFNVQHSIQTNWQRNLKSARIEHRTLNVHQIISVLLIFFKIKWKISCNNNKTKCFIINNNTIEINWFSK